MSRINQKSVLKDPYKCNGISKYLSECQLAHLGILMPPNSTSMSFGTLARDQQSITSVCVQSTFVGDIRVLLTPFYLLMIESIVANMQTK